MNSNTAVLIIDKIIIVPSPLKRKTKNSAQALTADVPKGLVEAVKIDLHKLQGQDHSLTIRGVGKPRQNTVQAETQTFTHDTNVLLAWQ